jgi:hypothetical protein
MGASLCAREQPLKTVNTGGCCNASGDALMVVPRIDLLIAPVVHRFIVLRESIAYREQHFKQIKRIPFNERLQLEVDKGELAELSKFSEVLLFIKLEREENVEREESERCLISTTPSKPYSMTGS